MPRWKVHIPSRRRSVAFTVAGTVVGVLSLGSFVLGAGYRHGGFLLRLVAILVGVAGFFLAGSLLQAGYEGDHPDRGGDGGGPEEFRHGIDTLAD